MGHTFLFFSAQYLPTAGGVERYTYNLAKRLLRQGNRVIVATSALNGLPAWETDPEGIEIYRFPSWLFLHGRLPLLKPTGEFHRLAKKLWAQGIYFCVINTYFYPLSMYAASRASKRQLPRILINHGSAWLMTGRKPLVLAGKLYEHIAARLCHHYCADFYGVSSAAVQWLSTFSIPGKGVVTNAIDPEEVSRSVSPGTDWRQRLGLSPDDRIIAFVGRMIPEKGVESVLSAMPRIREVHPNAWLLMAGDGPLFEKHQSRPPEGVFLLGGQAYGDVLALLQQADLFCLPSRSEGFACTVLEAAAMGCPIITTATGGSPQLLLDNCYGVLLKDMTPDTVAEACIQALSDPVWRENAARLAGQQLREHYTWDAALSQLYQAFHLE